MLQRPNCDTQEGRILAILGDGLPHTLYDWPRPDRYTGRNAISRLRARGYLIEAYFDRRRGVQTYRLLPFQEKLQLA